MKPKSPRPRKADSGEAVSHREAVAMGKVFVEAIIEYTQGPEFREFLEDFFDGVLQEHRFPSYFIHAIQAAQQQECKFFTPTQLARRWGVNHARVMTWIRKGELRAIHMDDQRQGRYKISAEAVELFESIRSVIPPPPRRPRPRRPKGYVDYFPE